MGTLKVFVPFLLISLFITIMATSQDDCIKSSMCSNTEPTVQFPFSLEGYQEERCGYPGFNLSCKKNRTVLQLGSSGEFYVRDINYFTQEVHLYDQDNCLPKRLLNLNLSGSPFNGVYYQNFQFFNCSSDYSVYYMQPITCLSTLNYTVFATPMTMSPEMNTSSCELFASITIPTEWPVYDFQFATPIQSDLHLIWDTPNCGECIQQGGQCGFKNNKSTKIKCFNHRRRVGVPKAVKYVLIIGVGIPILMCLIMLACYVRGRLKSYGGNNIRNHLRHHESSIVLPQPTVFVAGLDESVIQSYPKTVLGESHRLVKPDDNICPICLSEYRPKETLRTIPACKHCFHASCIDEWLRRNGTCPLCRNSPLSLPPPA